jgi:DNA-binding transcriptional LysR family regulator
MLRDGEADTALVFDALGETPADLGGLAQQVLFHEPFLVALPRTHPLANADVVPLRQLRDERWIVGTATKARGAIERACLAAGFTPQVAAAADDQPTIQALVAGAVGVTLIPVMVAPHARPDVVLRATRPKGISRRVSVITLDVNPRTPAVDAFIEQLMSVATRATGAATQWLAANSALVERGRARSSQRPRPG